MNLAWNSNGTAYADGQMSSHSVVAGGCNYGIGITYRLGSSRTKLFFEGRYHKAYTHDVANDHSGARDLKTIVMPITVGVRW